MKRVKFKIGVVVDNRLNYNNEVIENCIKSAINNCLFKASLTGKLSIKQVEITDDDEKQNNNITI